MGTAKTIAQVAPTDVPKDAMSRVITQYINNSARGGKSTEFMLVAKTDFIQPALDWTLQIKVDPVFLSNYPATEGKGSLDGLTVPKEDGRDYSGSIVLRNGIESESGRTAFHELIHAYHFSIDSEVDADATGGAEFVSGLFSDYVGRTRRIDNQMNAIIAKIKAGQDYQKDLDNAWKVFDMIATDMATWDSSVMKCIENIGGKSDIEGLRKAYQEMIDDARKGAMPGGSGDSGEKPGGDGAAGQRTSIDFDVRPGDWLNTGINLKKGQTVSLSAKGECKHPGKEGRTFGPGGYYWLGFQAWTFKAKMGDKITDIGSSSSYTAPVDGPLLIGMSGTYDPQPGDSAIQGSFKATVEGEIQSSGAVPQVFASSIDTPIAFHVACPVTVEVKDASGKNAAEIAGAKITSTPDGNGGNVWHGDLPQGEYTMTITGTAKGKFNLWTKQKGRPVFTYPTADCDKGTVSTVMLSDQGDAQPLKGSSVTELSPTAMPGGDGTATSAGGPGSAGGGGDNGASDGQSAGATGQFPPELTVGKGLKINRLVTFRKITNFERGNDVMVIHGAKIAADGSRIAFSSRTGTWIINPDGSNARQLSKKPSSHIDISNNGNVVVWFEQSDQPAVYAMNLADDEKVKMPGTFLGPSAVRVSGDGSKVFVTEPQKGNIFVMPADGSDLKTVITAKEICALLKIDENWNHWREHLDVSDDGSRVAFVFLWDAFAVNSDGSSLRRLTAYENYALTALALSGNGQRVVHHRGYGKESGVVFQNWDGGGTQLFPKTEEAGGRIDVSPDGATAYFSPGVRVFSSDGKTFFDPTNFCVNLWANPYNLTTTADGKRGCFTIDGPESVDQGRPSQLMIVDFDPSSFNGAPIISDIRVSPKFMVNDKSNNLTITAQVPAPAKDLQSVGAIPARSGTRFPDLNSGYPMNDAAQYGDETAEDSIYTTTAFSAYTYSGNPMPTGPIGIRLHVLDKNWNVTVVDIEGVEVRAP